ncbi:hypothetical protein [Henriciella aquimarina]|uniref:hypothetical protein n=1 Tax=Henriciella aquimarina TaxID=545261 RepID=UPI0009FBCF18|nr:hypothetical protein [Henriciella aquimarina]
MRRSIAVIAISTALAAGCATPSDDLDMRRPGAAVSQTDGVKAFSDAVLGHCLPAIHNNQAFADFEVKDVTPLGKLAENKISMFENKTLPVWQMVDGVVQIQLDESQSCAVKSYGLPVKATFRLVGNTALQTSYDYREEDVGFPQAGESFRRVLVSGTGADAVTLTLTGMEPGAPGNDEKYAKLDAVVSRGEE